MDKFVHGSIIFLSPVKQFQMTFDDLERRVKEFIRDRIIPAEKEFHDYASKNPWQIPPIIEELKLEAKKAGLWNLFLTFKYAGATEPPKLSNSQYCILCEHMGTSPIAPEVFNCSAPDTGNMEVLARFGNDQQKKQYLQPLLEGKIRSAFAMTEPDVSSSDASQISTSIAKEGDNYYILNGKKWWITGAGDPRCQFFLVMVRNIGGAEERPRHRQHSIVIVPRNAKGVKIVRPMTVFGFDESPHGHCEIEFTDVRIPRSNLVGKEGFGFHIVQSRLGPGRLHHCMRAIGMAERALSLLITRAKSRSAFGKPLLEHGNTKTKIAQLRVQINLARGAVLQASQLLDASHASSSPGGLNKDAIRAISIAKVSVPHMLVQVIDEAIQIHGAAGVSQDFPLALMYAQARTLRIADGPDEVHLGTIFKLELDSKL